MSSARISLFALLLPGGCASPAPIVQFTPAGSLPERGLPTAVRGALAAGARADAPWLPLHLAIDRNDAAALRALIGAGAPVDSDALGHAINAGNLPTIALLLSAGAPATDYREMLRVLQAAGRK